MNLATGIFGTSPSYAYKALHALLVLAMAALALALTYTFVTWLWPAWAAIALVLLVAHRIHPGVRWTWFFMPPRRTFTALVMVAGLLFRTGVVEIFDAAAGRGGGFAGFAIGMVCYIGAVLAAMSIVKTFEGSVMTQVFKLVPPERAGWLLEKLQALDAKRAGGAGQVADFRDLDPAGVAASLKARVIGQDATVDAVVSTAFRRARLARPQKPVATFLFVGATGAGKTELAKALAAELFQGRMIRVDCNELSAEHGVQRLIGSPPGYVGSDEGGWLCRELGRVGTGVLLLDEIEKAHPAVLKTLMGLLDEARITEQSTSQVYSARGFLIVLTSNAAAAEIAEVARVETDPTLRSVKTRDALKASGFLPEVLARLDQVFAFAPLAAADYARVVEKFLAGFGAEVGVEVVEADSELLLDLVTKAMTTSAYGVREVVRAVENSVVDGLIAVKDTGATRAAIRVRGGQVIVEKMEVTK